ncbi:adenylosuccinate lyase [Candidatus Peregrinibacteria bacterium]|nr:adenylosuccinate lyase [Candidatus Peregrinibacteria bacterium]
MITSLSPLDGRYAKKVQILSEYFSEYALHQYRLTIEVEWLLTLAAEPGIKELPKATEKEVRILNTLLRNFTPQEAERIREIEKITNHDVKAVEYYLREKLANTSLKKHLEFIHFACTSEDINNLAYSLMIKLAGEKVILPVLDELLKTIQHLARQWIKVPLLALTHGQPATPTTVGKELLVFAMRLERQISRLKKQDIAGKINGATGNFNAHCVAYPKVDWRKLSKKFVQNLGLMWNPCTTQIEPHDTLAEIFNTIQLINTILIGFDRDIWGYISRGVFKQKTVAGEVGSSTMPHKVNPIDFENSEGNFGIANALFRHMSEKLPISRFQRDLSDSTVERNIGVAFGHSLLAWKSTLKGMHKLELNGKNIREELDNQWELLAEPIQTVLRKHGVTGAYEKLKELTRGKKVTQKIMREFIRTLPVPKEDKIRLLKLTPETYIGLADQF